MTAPTVRNPRWQGAVLADKRSVSRLRQELGIHEGTKQRITKVALQSPQTLCLWGGQSEPRHLDEFPLYSLEHFIDEHGIPPFTCFLHRLLVLLCALLTATVVPREILR
jgi:hypothetical protein